MNITVSEELRAYIDPLTPHEHEALERSLMVEGCRDALVLWGDVLVDGHNRYGICSRLGIAFNTVQNTQFKSIDDVHLWMIDQHLGRRSLSDFQRGVLALRRKDILTDSVPAVADAATTESSVVPVSSAANNHADAMTTSDATAKAARLSSSTLSHIKKIQQTAAPELVAAVKSGSISITAAANVASLPVAEQVAAAAGGKKELQQAARQVRESRAVERSEPDSPAGVIARLKQIITTLSAENASLKAQLAELTG